MSIFTLAWAGVIVFASSPVQPDQIPAMLQVGLNSCAICASEPLRPPTKRFAP